MGMEKAELQDKVCTILADQLAVDRDKVTPDARFSEDLDADSLDLVEAVLALEEEFGVSIPEDEMEGVKTVGQAVDLVATTVGASA
jgi:acyl carrier protein